MKLKNFLAVSSATLLISACGMFGGTKPPISDNERQESATLALLCADVMDTFQANRQNPTPPILNNKYSLLPKHWIVDGYIVGEDRTLDEAIRNKPDTGRMVMYGVLAHSNTDPHNFVVAIRGTGTPQEWKQDAWFFSLPDKWNDTHGKVEAGFFSIYKTFKYYPAASSSGNSDPANAWKGIKDTVGTNALTVTGHSLGAPLATYLSFDLIEQGGIKNLAGRYFASPRPGNSEFANAFDKAIRDSHSNYIVYNYALDGVPQTPPSVLGLFYQQLNNVTTLNRSNAQATIKITKGDIGCAHHAVSYAAMLDFHLLPDINAWKQRYKDNGDSDKCI
jgi:hypothetical protein